MLRRLLPTLIALVVGLAGLGWGLGYLQRIFAAEREDAQASLDSRREALEQYARASLAQSLRDRLESARPALEAAVVDPLVSAAGLYLRERGEQLLPRLSHHDTGEDGWVGTCPVGTFPPNDLGLFETTGNVWEWCADWFSPDAYRRSPLHGPVGPRKGVNRVMRGGSYLCHESYCWRYRVDSRSSNTPDSSAGNVGFRVAADVE